MLKVKGEGRAEEIEESKERNWKLENGNWQDEFRRSSKGNSNPWVLQFRLKAGSEMLQRSTLYARWAQEVRKSKLFRAGERVGVAVSGGPDSVLLLHFMKRLAKEMGLKLAVVHFNHHLRGAESEADESFVAGLAEHLELEFLRGEADVAEAARERRRNLEATARELRYRFFFSLVNKGRLDKVATAHTANDQAETVLLRLLRGAGTRGLGGIYPLLEGKVARPFLSLTREAVLHELEERRIESRTDSTNFDTRLRRNKLRQELLPRLEKEFNPEIVLLLKELADRARDDEAYLEAQAHERAKPWRVREGAEEKIPARALAEFPPAVARRVLRQMLVSVRGSGQGVTHAHIEALRHLASEAQSGRSLELPGGGAGRKEFEWLIVAPSAGAAGEPEFAYPVKVPGELTLPQFGVTLRFKIVGSEASRTAYNGFEKARLDPRKMPGELVLRNWRPGDSFWPSGDRKRRKLKELFLAHRIPRAQRRLWPVLESGGEIVWVRGFPPASSAAAADDTDEILVIEERVFTPR